MHAAEQLRRALADVEAQRDSGLAYLGALKRILEVLDRTHGVRPCAHAMARAIVEELHVESCAIVLREGDSHSVVGYASQGARFGEAGGGVQVAEIVTLASSVWTGVLEGGSGRDGDRLEAHPLVLSGSIEGALVLHRLVPLGPDVAERQATALVAAAVAHALGVARSHDALAQSCDRLREELGETRALLSTHETSLVEREASVSELERTLGRLTDELARANRVKQEVLGTVSHELRTPLNAILGFGHLLCEDLDDGRHLDEVDMLRSIVEAGRRLNGMIDDMLLFAELSSSRIVPDVGEVHLTGLLESAIAQLEEPVRDGVALHVEVAPEADVVRVDRRLLERVALHALDNACRFSGEGDVTVRAKVAARDHLVLEFEDAGDGIAPEDAKRLFEPFARSDRSRRHRSGGLGLGLALVNGVATLLGGEVELDSRPGLGTTLRVVLPGAIASGRDAGSAGHAA